MREKEREQGGNGEASKVTEPWDSDFDRFDVEPEELFNDANSDTARLAWDAYEAGCSTVRQFIDSMPDSDKTDSDADL